MPPRHIISWGCNERPLSPVSSTSTSVLSIESITSDTSSAAPEVSRATQSRVKSMDFSGVLGKRESVVQHALDEPFTRHDKYYFKDGNITFLVRFTFGRMQLDSLVHIRSMAPSTVSTDTSSPGTRLTSPLDLTNLAFASTRLYPSSYR